MGSSEEYYLPDIHFDSGSEDAQVWWCHDVMSPGAGHRPHSEASHRNMAIILTTLSPIIMILGRGGRDQSEDRVWHSGPIGGQLTEVAGWYQAESDLANNSRTQTSLAKTAIIELRLVHSPVSSSSGSVLNCWAWSCLNEMRISAATRYHVISGQSWEAGIWSNILTNYVWPCKKQSNDPSQAWLDRYNRLCSAQSPDGLGLVPAQR